jgi:glucose-1-phosphate adenylyltransferase
MGADLSTQFGVMEIDENNHVIGFEEKPKQPKTVPGDPDHIYASMGIYVFTARFLFEQLLDDANRQESRHDFGRDIIPSVISSNRVLAFPFRDQQNRRDAYWRDVGTIDAYYEANMDLVSVEPELNLYSNDWPIRTYQPVLPPPKFVFRGGQDAARQGRALDSIVCLGSIISGGLVQGSIIGSQARVNSYSDIQDSILFDGVEVGRHCKIRRAIIDKYVSIPPHTQIGYDLEMDRARGFTVSERGVVVIPRVDSLEDLLSQGR